MILEVVLSPSRRVKKGPGRRPQSAKRQRFVELRERGWSVNAAAREVGVSRTVGNNWAYGYKTYRAGQVVGFEPALDRLAVREISAPFLSQDERIEIADLHRAGCSVREIARRLGRAPSTISRELRAGERGLHDASHPAPTACSRHCATNPNGGETTPSSVPLVLSPRRSDRVAEQYALTT